MKVFKKSHHPSEVMIKRVYPLVAILSVVLLLFCQSSCRQDVDCTSPPPSFYFQIQKDGITYPSQKDTLRGFGVYYVTDQQTKIYIPGIAAQENIFQSGVLISKSRELNDQEFVIEIEGQTFTKLKLETYVNPTRCNNWPQVSKVYSNGILVDKNTTGVYVVTSN